MTSSIKDTETTTKNDKFSKKTISFLSQLLFQRCIIFYMIWGWRSHFFFKSVKNIIVSLFILTYLFIYRIKIFPVITSMVFNRLCQSPRCCIYSIFIDRQEGKNVFNCILIINRKPDFCYRVILSFF